MARILAQALLQIADVLAGPTTTATSPATTTTPPATPAVSLTNTQKRAMVFTAFREATDGRMSFEDYGLVRDKAGVKNPGSYGAHGYIAQVDPSNYYGPREITQKGLDWLAKYEKQTA